MKNLGVALIGSGYIAHYHARALKTMPNVSLKALCSLDPAQAADFAQTYKIETVVTDIDELTGRDDIQAVVISTPNRFHAPYAIEFMTQGKDVFVEKPMAVSTDQTEAMMACANDTGRVLMVGHMWRFDREVNLIRDLVQSKKLGTVVKTKGYGIHVNWGPAGWFVDPDLAGGGALVDMGVHAIDTVRYLLGDPEPKAVYAKISTSFGDYEVDDTSVVIITWDTGTVSIIESGWWHPHADGPEAGTQLFGTGGYASLFPTTYTLKVGDEMKQVTPDLPKRKEHCDQPMYTNQMEHFIECIETGKQPLAGMREGHAALAIVQAAYESARTEQVVTI